MRAASDLVISFPILMGISVEIKVESRKINVIIGI